MRGDRYATVHVTPEEAYSYASFECNFDFNGLGSSWTSSDRNPNPNPHTLQELVEKVLNIFEPSKMSITLFVSDDEEGEESKMLGGGGEKSLKSRAHSGMRQLSNPSLVEKYERVDRILYEFEGYSLVYAVFQKRVDAREEEQGIEIVV